MAESDALETGLQGWGWGGGWGIGEKARDLTTEEL